jgi:hypothetical protein
MDNPKALCWLGVVIIATLLPSPSDVEAQDDEPHYARRTVWDESNDAELGVSGFAFRDLNRNGVYDLVDRPMADVVFELTGPEHSYAIKRSNINGFANFGMSARKEDADVIRPGRYRYQTIIPPDWTLTTGNAAQTTFMELSPGSPAGMISTTQAAPVGLAPVLKVEGQVQQPAILLATGPNGTKQEILLDKEGHFSIPVTSGTWLLVAVEKSTGWQTERRISVGEMPVRLSKIIFENSAPTPAPAAHLVGFDDLLKTITVLEIPVGYGHLGWRNWVATHNLKYGGGGYVNTTVSGEFVAYNSSGHPVRIYRDKPFDFRGGYFGVAWKEAEGETLTIKGWRNDQLIYEDSLQLSTLGPVYFDADYRAVTRLEFATLHYWQFVCDDLSIGLEE